VFIALARWGRNPVFDRAWTILSILLMGFLAAPFHGKTWRTQYVGRVEAALFV